MALTTIPDGLWTGPNPSGETTGYTIDVQTQYSLNGTTRQRVAWILDIPKSGTLDKIEVYVGVISSPSDIKFSFQNIDASGLPDGTIDEFRVVASGSIAVGWLVPGLITSDGTDGGTKRSVTAGQQIAVVVEWDSTQSGEVWFSGLDVDNEIYTKYPYGAVHNGASWTKFVSSIYPTLVFKYNDASYVTNGFIFPLEAVTTRTFNSGSSPDERALYFSFPVSVAIDCIEIVIDFDNACDIILYDTDGTTALMTRTLDSDVRAGTTTAWARFYFDPITLTAAGNYRLAVKPGASSVSIYEFTSAVMGAFWGGSSFHLSTRTDAGSWSQTTTERPFMAIRVIQIEASSGGGQRSYVG